MKHTFITCRLLCRGLTNGSIHDIKGTGNNFHFVNLTRQIISERAHWGIFSKWLRRYALYIKDDGGWHGQS